MTTFHYSTPSYVNPGMLVWAAHPQLPPTKAVRCRVVAAHGVHAEIASEIEALPLRALVSIYDLRVREHLRCPPSRQHAYASYSNFAPNIFYGMVSARAAWCAPVDPARKHDYLRRKKVPAGRYAGRCKPLRALPKGECCPALDARIPGAP